MTEDTWSLPQDSIPGATHQQAAPEWLGSRGHFARALRSFAAQTILRHAQGRRALVCGSGNGTMADALVRRFPELVVVEDGDPGFDGIPPCLSRWIELRHMLIEEFEPDRSLDAVILAWVLEHVPDPRSLLRRAQSWLSPGGRIHIIVPNAGSLHRRLGRAMGMLSEVTDLSDSDLDSGHRRVYTWPALRADIGAAGLHVLAREGICLKPLPGAQMGEWPSDLLAGLYAAGRELPELCSEIYAACVPAGR